jgi:hypothetical protein
VAIFTDENARLLSQPPCDAFQFSTNNFKDTIKKSLKISKGQPTGQLVVNILVIKSILNDTNISSLNVIKSSFNQFSLLAIQTDRETGITRSRQDVVVKKFHHDLH